jgi:Fe-S cluster assembly iron-binding protein IscA
MVMAKRSEPVTAVAAADWIQVVLTQRAAEFAKQSISDSKFPAGTGLRIEDQPATASVVIKFDLPSDRGGDFVGEDQGVSVFIEKSLVARLLGKMIDVENGALKVVAASVS